MKQSEMALLVLAAQQGNRGAFGALYQHLTPKLLRFAYKECANAAMAQDAVQEAWLKIAMSLRKLEDAAAFRAWLYRNVRWRIIDALRRNQRFVDASYADGAACDQASEKPSENMADAFANSRDLAGAIARLPPTERSAVQLFYLDELSVLEIAEVLDVPKGTVKSRLNRARTLLKQKFDHQSE